MSNKKAKSYFKEIINLCYEEDFPELHQELFSLENVTKKNSNPYKYEDAIEEVFNIIPLFAEDFPDDTMEEIKKLFEEFLLYEE